MDNLIAIQILRVLVQAIDILPEDDLVPCFMMISDQKGVSEHITSFALDAMLVAEHDFEGEYTSKKEVLQAFGEQIEYEKSKEVLPAYWEVIPKGNLRDFLQE
jgi:hypothetical protein